MEIRLGTITGAHGVKGWLKVYSYTDPVDAIMEYSPWTLRRDRDAAGKDAEARSLQEEGLQVESVKVVAHRAIGKRLVAQLAGIDTRDAAEALRGYGIWLERARLPELGKGEYYWFELEGLTVRNTDEANLGVVSRMLETGANDVLVVKPTADSVDDRERLVPYVEGEVVLKVDVETREMVVDWELDY